MRTLLLAASFLASLLVPGAVAEPVYCDWRGLCIEERMHDECRGETYAYYHMHSAFFLELVHASRTCHGEFERESIRSGLVGEVSWSSNRDDEGNESRNFRLAAGSTTLETQEREQPDGTTSCRMGAYTWLGSYPYATRLYEGPCPAGPIPRGPPLPWGQVLP